MMSQLLAIVLVMALLLPSALRLAAIQFGFIPETQNKTVKRGRMTAKIEGDFVVFIIGARSNREWALTSNVSTMGKAFTMMTKELQDHPELGCLGSEDYSGNTRDQSTVFSVQHWRSVEHLQKYATSTSNEHYPGWKFLMKIGKMSEEVAFWHETFLVKDGQYEAIYVNSPPVHLMSARETKVLPAQGQYTTMRSRLKKENGAVPDWDPALQETATY